MGRKIGSKNKTVNTAKNKNVININVNSTTSKKSRGRPRKTTANAQNRMPTYGGGNSMAPPQVIISQPQADNSNNNSLLSSFITSKMLNETMNLNRTYMTTVEPPREQPSYFNSRESIIPKLPDTPNLKQKDIIQEVKPPPPPPPPIAAMKKEPAKPFNLSGLSGRDAMMEELKYAQTDEGKAEKAKKKAETAAKREAKKLEKETTSQPQSTTDFLNMSFTPPKKDIVEMMTPSKEPTSTAITPYKGQQSTLEFLMGGTPQKTKPTQEDKKKARLTELKKKEKINAKELFELNDLKSHFTIQPNPNKDIARSIIGESIKRKAAYEKVKKNIKEKPIKTIQAIYRGNKIRNKLANDPDFQNKIDMKIKKYGDAASEYKTRGADAQDINKEFSDVMKTMRTGLQKYKTTLGTQPKKRGPKPKNPYSGLKKTEL